MDLYAIEITEETLGLITLLNQGVTPRMKAKPTYFVFDAEWNSEVPNEIVTQNVLLNEYSKLSHVPIHKAIRAN